MRKVIFLPIVTGLLSLAFLTSCEGEKYVTIPPMVDDVITNEGMISILGKHGLEIPPTYIPTPGTGIRAVVIPVDIWTITGGETYNEVRITVTLFEREGNSLKPSENSAFITGVPQNVREKADVEEIHTVAGNFAAAASELTKKIGSITFDAKLERTIKETYPKLYQTVGFNIRPPSLVWTFIPFKNEQIPTGTYYIFALVDVRDPTQGLQIEAKTSCKYKAPVLFGLFKIPLDCKPDYREHDLVPAAQPELAQTEPPQPEPPQPEPVQSEPPQPEPAQPELVQTYPPQPVPPLPSEEIVLVFGGWEQFREAVLDAVDWSSLTREQNVNLIFTDLEVGQVNLSSRERDVGRCQRWLAEAGHPDGYTNFRVMIVPGSEALTRTAEALGTYLADCGIGISIDTVNSISDAYIILESLSAAGESGLLLSIQAEE